MIDLRQAIKIRSMLHNAKEYKIGICRRFPGEFPIHKEGDVILFRPTDAKYCVIETPISDDWLEKNIKEGNGIKTIGTCVGVPLSYIQEVLL